MARSGDLSAYSHIRGILYDKDGTLFDFHRTWRPVMAQAAALAVPGDAALAGRMLAEGGYDAASGRFLPDSLIAAGHAGELAALWVAMGAEFEVEVLRARLDELFATVALDCAVAVTDLPAHFSLLHAAGLVQGVATNDSAVAAERTVAHFGIERWVGFVAGYDSGYGAKPGPGMALAFCEASGLAPGEVAMVGDSEHDIATGRAAGLGLCVGVMTGAGTRETLGRVADVVLDDITGLRPLLARG
ncbi:MAG: HAD family hydrolase [Rhodocyclaceae bacterium]